MVTLLEYVLGWRLFLLATPKMTPKMKQQALLPNEPGARDSEGNWASVVTK